MSLRSKLIVVFLLATLLPLAVTLWITTQLLETSLTYNSTVELDEMSRSLEIVGREFYQEARDDLKASAQAGGSPAKKFAAKDAQPPAVAAFAASGEPEHISLAGEGGRQLYYMVRKRDGEIWLYTKDLGAIGMDRLSAQIRRARTIVERSRVLDLRRGLTFTLLAAAAGIYLTSLAILIWIAIRISRPMRQLRRGLATLAAGDFSVRLPESTADEAGQAVAAFNRTAVELEENRERLVQLTRVASWQSLARKMAHEVKNSLTPIRLTMEELGARSSHPEPAFLRQASQIVVDEVSTLEKRVRAFSDFAAEPRADIQPVDLNTMVEERVAFLRPTHPNTEYRTEVAQEPVRAAADPDLVRGVLTNLLENAAQAAGCGGVVRASTFVRNGRSGFEIEDSGPGLSTLAESTLFEPSISFKKNGMGLGLSIARRSILLCGGDIQHRKGELGGAAFRVLLPPAQPLAPHLDS